MAGNDDTRTNRQADNHQACRTPASQPKEHLHRRHRPNGIYKIRGGDVVDDDDVTYKIRLKWWRVTSGLLWSLYINRIKLLSRAPFVCCEVNPPSEFVSIGVYSLCTRFSQRFAYCMVKCLPLKPVNSLRSWFVYKDTLEEGRLLLIMIISLCTTIERSTKAAHSPQPHEWNLFGWQLIR